MSRKFHSQQYWEEKIRHRFVSGKSIKSWCLENGIAYNTFLKWQNRLKHIENVEQRNLNLQKMHFIELENKPVSQSRIFLEFEGIQIHLAPDFDATSLRKCINALRETIC